MNSRQGRVRKKAAAKGFTASGWMVAAALFPQLAVVGVAGAQSAAAAATDQSELLRRLEEQENRVKVLERKLEIREEDTKAAAASAPVVKTGPQGFSFASADGRNVIKLRGNFAFDGRWYADDFTAQTADTWLFRRVRPYLEGTLNGIYDFRLMPDFAGGKTIIVDAYAAGRFKPWATVTVGKFKGPVGLERLQPDQYNRFIELGLPSALVPNRDLGVQFSGAVGDGRLSYQLGYFNGVADGTSTDANASPDVDNDGKKEWEGRLFSLPFVNSDNFFLRNLGVGLGGSAGKSTGSATSTLVPSYRTPGQQPFFSYRTGTTPTLADGSRYRLSPQLYYSVSSFSLLSEYVVSSAEVRRINGAVNRTAKLKNTAWQVQLAWFLTGEDESYAAFTPNTTFEAGKPGWGAWELALRYHQLNIDDAAFVGGADSFANPATAPAKASAIGVGVNWYLNQNIKWVLNYEVTKFDGGSAAGADRPDEKAIFTRFALIF
jgi:phosphate-selective porin OprO/OprP